MQRCLARLLVLLAALLAASPAGAQTTDEIIKRGKVIIGVNTTTPIFGLWATTASPRATTPTSRAWSASISACRSSSFRSPAPTASRSS